VRSAQQVGERYELLRVLGEGSFSTVVLARDKRALLARCGRDGSERDVGEGKVLPLHGLVVVCVGAVLPVLQPVKDR
jgi:hypothetical protein